MIDLSTAQAEGAIFTPAIQPIYADNIDPQASQSRPIPGGYSASDLDFLNPSSRLFHLKYALYSAGWAIKAARQPNMLVNHDRNSTVLIGDSGGYQIIKGHLGTVDNTLRGRILNWLETYCDIAMTLDVPTIALKSPESGYTKFENCLSDTLTNLDYFNANRTPGKIRFLNVLQGNTPQQSNKWYDAVKDYPFEGWAIAGPLKKSLFHVIRRILTIRDDKLLGDRSWVHILGIGTPRYAVAISYLQEAMRLHVDPDFTISIDVSSPFLSVSKRQVFLQGGLWPQKFGVVSGRVPDDKRYIGSNHRLPLHSPIGEHLTLGDICVRDEPFKKRTYDSLSYTLLMHNNVFVHAKNIIDATRLAQLDPRSASQFVPSSLTNARNAIHAIVSADDWQAALNRARATLNRAIPFNEPDEWEEDDDER